MNVATTNKGFTLIEILLMIAITSVLLSVSLVAFASSQRQTTLNNNQMVVRAALEQARSRAVSGVGTTDHGVRINQTEVIHFAGNSYPGSGQSIPLSPTVTTDQTNTDIIFTRLSGRTISDVVITISNSGGESKTVTVSTYGNIY